MKKLNKFENNNIFTFSLLLIVAIMVLSLCFFNNDLVFAEDTDTILNFNQLSQNLNTAVSVASGGNAESGYYYVNISQTTYPNFTAANMGFNNLDSSHYYYYKCYYSAYTDNLSHIRLYFNNYSSVIWLRPGYSSGRVTNLSTYNLARTYKTNSSTASYTLYFNFIDLTLMYGSGNEPSLAQCDEIFTANYYKYTSGTAITKSAFENYNNGYAQAILDIEGSMQVEQTSLNSYYLFTYQMKEGLSEYPGSIPFTKTYVEDRDVYAVIVAGDAVAYLPFKIAANTTLTLNIGLLSTWGADNQDAPFDYNISYLYNGSVINLYSGQLASTTTSLVDANFNFFIPVDIDGIMIYSDDYTENSGEYLVIANVEASYKTYNILDLVTKAQTEAYTQGQADVDTDYYYNWGFREGVAEGKLSSNDALENGFWTWFNSMLSGIGSIFNIELFSGITIGIVILIPLLFSILLLVLRLVRGG